MRSQQPGMSQSQPRQQSGSNDMQLLQQHLMYKRLQELQQQQQFQQLTQAGRQHNSVIQLSAGAKQAAAAQLPALLNGMPVSNMPSYMRQNEFIGCESKISTSSNMFACNNWPQPTLSPAAYGFSNGLIFPNEQSQSLQPMGFVPQPNQSLYGTPVSSSRASLNQYTQFEGLPNASIDVMTMESGNRSFSQRECPVMAEQGAVHDTMVAKHGFQENDLFVNVRNQNQVNNSTPEPFSQASPQSQSIQVQEYQSRQEASDLSGSLQEKAVVPGGSSRGVSRLDPTEKKLLFGTDNDANWVASFGRSGETGTGGYLHGNPSGDNDYFGTFPSIQSGSWSALMLDALDVSSSDTGVQEEWSGVSFQKTELTNGNHPALLSDAGKQQTWNDINMQNATALRSRPFPLFNESESSLNCHPAPNFQPPPVRFSYEHNEQASFEVAHDSPQQSTKEAEMNHLNQSHQQKQCLEGGFEHKMQLHQSGGIGAGHMSEQKAGTRHTGPPDLKTLASAKGIWPNQKNTHSSDLHGTLPAQLSLKQDGWHRNGPGSPGSSGSLAVDGGNDRQRPPHKGDINRTMHTETDRDGRMRMTVFGETKQEPSLQKVAPSEECSPSQSASSQLGDNRNFARENLFFARNSRQFDIEGHSTVGPSGQENSEPHRLQHHHMGNVVMNMEPADVPTQASYLQVLPQFQILENLNQSHSGSSHFVSPFLSSNAVDMGKGQVANYQANVKRSVEVLPGSSTSCTEMIRPVYLGGTASQWSQNKTVGQTSKNMLELLKKSDQSRESMTVAQFEFPNHRSQSEIPNFAPSHPQYKQSSALQGFGLQLAPPSQKQSVPNHTLLPQSSSHDLNANQLDQDGAGNGHKWSDPTTSTQSVIPAGETSQRENSDSKSSISGRGDKEASDSGDHINLLSATSSSPYFINRQQLHNSSTATGHGMMDQVIDGSSGGDPQVEKASSSGPPHDPYSRTMTNKAVLASLSSASGRTPSFKLPSSSDTRAPVSSQSHSVHTSQSQSMNASLAHIRNSSQHIAPSHMKAASQPSASSMSKQDGYSTMLNNVWKNVTSQRISGVQPQRFISNIFQSMIPSTSSGDMNTWTPQQGEDQSNRRGSNLPGSATCFGNSQEVTHGDALKEIPIPKIPSELVDAAPKVASGHHEQGPAARHLSDGNSAVSISSLVRLHQHDLSRPKYTNNSDSDPQTHATPQDVTHSSPDIGLRGQCPKQSDEVQQENYSLLKQVQSMKAVESERAKRIGKKTTGADIGSDAVHMDSKAAQMFTFGQNTIFSAPADSELGLNSHSSSPSDVKMLSFNESQSASSGVLGRELSAQNIGPSERHDLRSHTGTRNSQSTATVACERPYISPQMAPSWFEQYGNYKNGQILGLYDKQNFAKLASQQLSLAKVSESMYNSPGLEQEEDTNNKAAIGQSTSAMLPNVTAAVPSHYAGHDLVLRPKKRKRVKPELLPWHKVVVEGPRKRPSISMGELDWTKASNRLIEKVEDEIELVEEGPSIPRLRRRIILTTQLMQLLFPSVPTAILIAEAKSSYESLTYFSARSALADACCSIAPSGTGSCVNAQDENAASEKPKTSEVDGQQIFLRVVENIMGRSSKLESDFTRLDKRTSMLDLRIECQELERFSIINRLGKFHGRSQTDAIESSLNPQSALRRLFPQRYVTALPLTGNLPEGVNCFPI